MGLNQFLISYWWLIVLVIIFIAVITRNLIKFIIVLVGLIVLVNIFWALFISSGFTKSTQCFTDEAKLADISYQKAQMVNPGNERNQFICTQNEESYKRLISCFTTSKLENPLSFFIYSKLPTFIKTINDTIESHNKLCPGTPLASPNF